MESKGRGGIEKKRKKDIKVKTRIFIKKRKKEKEKRMSQNSCLSVFRAKRDDDNKWDETTTSKF